MSFFGSSSSSSSQNTQEEDDDEVPAIAKAAGLIAGAAFAAWGISKLFKSPEPTTQNPESSTNNMTLESLDHRAYEPEGYNFNRRAYEPSVSYPKPEPNGNYFNQMAYKPDPEASGGRIVKWTPPVEGWLRINTDASVKFHSAAIGGVFRDSRGDWVEGFAGKIEICDIPGAELRAIRRGLMRAWNKGYRKIEVETDSQAAIWLIEEAKITDDAKGQIIQDCRNLLQRNWMVELHHCSEKANRVADFMANLGHNLVIDIKFYDKPPEGVLPRLDNDTSW